MLAALLLGPDLLFAAMIRTANPQICVLERVVEAGASAFAGTLLGLHREYSTLTEILPLLRRIAGARQVIAPRSARWSAHEDGGRFSWFSDTVSSKIEPIGFGDSLLQLELLAFEFAEERPAVSPVVFGVGQGGTMAVALGALWPELFTKIVAVEATWPDVPGWEIPAGDMSGTQALLVGQRDCAQLNLSSRGAHITTFEDRSSNGVMSDSCIEDIRDWISTDRGMRV